MKSTDCIPDLWIVKAEVYHYSVFVHWHQKKGEGEEKSSKFFKSNQINIFTLVGHYEHLKKYILVAARNVKYNVNVK